MDNLSATHREFLTTQISHSSTSSTANSFSTSTISSASSVNTTVTTHDPSSPHLSIDSLVTSLDDQKLPFLNEVQLRVSSHIQSTSRREILSVIEKDGISAGKDRKHEPGIDSYIKVFGCFVAKTDYHGHGLDSALSEPVAKMASDCYATFISSRQAEIAEFFLKRVVDNQVLRTTMLEFAAEEVLKKGLVNKGRNHIVAVLSHSLAAHASHTHIGLVIQHGVLVATHHVAAVVGSTAGTAAGTLLAALIIKAVASHMGVTMTDVLHNGALHGLTVVLSHKVGMAACAGVAVNFLATHIGTAGAAVVAHSLITPVAAGVLFFTLKRLPKSMGKKVGEGVKEKLAGEFRSMTSSVLSGLVKEVFNVEALGKAIANEIIGMEDWQSLFDGSVVDMSNTLDFECRYG